MTGSLPRPRTAEDYLRTLPGFQRDNARAVHKAVYTAAVGMTDTEIEAVVKDALIRARRALSS